MELMLHLGQSEVLGRLTYLYANTCIFRPQLPCTLQTSHLALAERELSTDTGNNNPMSLRILRLNLP